MNRGIYSTTLGMSALQRGLDVTANNLANASTNGFKRDGLIFQDTLKREMYANGGFGQSVGVIGAGAQAVEEFTVRDLGTISTTNNPLDMAITVPQGMFAIKAGNEIHYTRDGAFALDSERQLVNKAGMPVLDKNGDEITIPAGTVQVENGGRILVNGAQVAEVGVFELNANSKFEKLGENLYRATNGAKPLDESLIAASSIESSNVNTVESMLDMIKIGRLFELSQKNIQSQDELLQRLISSLNE
ncbi:MAG: flagellar hook-basal body protein [Chlorobia bacterium]|nr:flagellar hook-basal body protein [Fimbriimonadaceae bacterium]